MVWIGFPEFFESSIILFFLWRRRRRRRIGGYFLVIFSFFLVTFSSLPKSFLLQPIDFLLFSLSIHPAVTQGYYSVFIRFKIAEIVCHCIVHELLRLLERTVEKSRENRRIICYFYLSHCLGLPHETKAIHPDPPSRCRCALEFRIGEPVFHIKLKGGGLRHSLPFLASPPPDCAFPQF